MKQNELHRSVGWMFTVTNCLIVLKPAAFNRKWAVFPQCTPLWFRAKNWEKRKKFAINAGKWGGETEVKRKLKYCFTVFPYFTV